MCRLMLVQDGCGLDGRLTGLWVAFPDTGCPGAVIREPRRAARRLPLVRRTG